MSNIIQVGTIEWIVISWIYIVADKWFETRIILSSYDGGGDSFSLDHITDTLFDFYIIWQLVWFNWIINYYKLEPWIVANFKLIWINTHTQLTYAGHHGKPYVSSLLIYAYIHTFLITDFGQVESNSIIQCMLC